MRSPLDNPVGRGRVAGIQPDFAVVKMDDRERTAVLVVECKQYRVAAPKRFRDALTDYARGAPIAEVVLVNYGPAKHTITEHMDNELAERAHPIGEFRPDSSSGSVVFFRELAVSALRPHFKPKSLPPLPKIPNLGRKSIVTLSLRGAPVPTILIFTCFFLPRQAVWSHTIRRGHWMLLHMLGSKRTLRCTESQSV